MKQLWIILSLAILMACESEKTEKNNADSIIFPRMEVTIEGLQLRQFSSLESQSLETFKKGSTVYDMEEVSESLIPMLIDSVLYCEPWMKVKTTKGQEGWVYAAGIDFKENQKSLINKRTEALFGPRLKDSLEAYQSGILNIAEEESYMESLFRTGKRLQNELNQILETTSYVLMEPYGLPDLFWMEEIFPGFVPQLVAEGTRYQFFVDYKQFLELCAKHERNNDKQFFGICVDIYPVDSIEYYFPVWSIQTWDYGGHSLFGKGIHKEILGKLDSFSQDNVFYTEEINTYRQQIIDDITGGEVTYWEDQEKLLKEINEIIAEELTFLSDADKIALDVRSKQFLEPEKYGIRLNIRAGEGF